VRSILGAGAAARRVAASAMVEVSARAIAALEKISLPMISILLVELL
jgi:hypothetical protein